MNYISDILFWISTGLLIPVIVLLILLFGRALLLIGSFFGQYLSVRKAQAIVDIALKDVTTEGPDAVAEKLPPILPLRSSARSWASWSIAISRQKCNV